MSVPPVVRHRSCSEHIPIELWSRRELEMEDSIVLPVVNRFLVVEVGSFKNTGSLNGRLIGVHKVLCSAAEIACKGRQDFYLGQDGGYMIPSYSKIGQEMRNHFEKLVVLAWKG